MIENNNLKECTSDIYQQTNLILVLLLLFRLRCLQLLLHAGY